jgi:hypothetical protein
VPAADADQHGQGAAGQRERRPCRGVSGLHLDLLGRG